MGRTAISESEILNAMVVGGAVSRGDLCQMLGLSKAAVTQVVNRLLERKLVIEGQLLEENRVGRKKIQLSVQPDMAYFLGADLEGLAIRACVLDCTYKIIASGKRAISPGWSKAKIMRQWRDLVEDVLKNSQVSRGKIAGFGVGLPGTVAREQLSTRAYLPPGQWVDFGISNFKQQLGFNLTVSNNVVCVSEYERKNGAAVNVPDFISVLARYGIGASIYSNGSLTVGQELTTGELGHMRIDLRGPECICGQKGCLDVFASGRTWIHREQLSEKMLTRQLKHRAGYIGIGLANMLKLFHPPLIIINGIYNDYEQIVKPIIVETLDAELRSLKVPVPQVIFGAPVELKTSMGAAMRAAKIFFQKDIDEKVF